MTRKAIIAAIACAVAGLVMLFLYMQRFEEEASGGPPVMVLIATRDIHLGTAITEDMLARGAGLADVALDHVQAAGCSRPRQLGNAPQRFG